MEPNLFGRKLGIGIRVASRMAKARAASASRGAEEISRQAPREARRHGPVFVAKGVAKGRALSEGSRRFGQAFLGPLRHVTGVLLLEISGVFFGLFALFFAQSLYKIRDQYAAGPQHHRFFIYAAGALVFFYFAVSSFLRARRKGTTDR